MEASATLHRHCAEKNYSLLCNNFKITEVIWLQSQGDTHKTVSSCLLCEVAKMGSALS